RGFEPRPAHTITSHGLQADLQAVIKQTIVTLRGRQDSKGGHRQAGRRPPFFHFRRLIYALTFGQKTCTWVTA
ncbi:MAG: hypothetical protein WBF71_05545, partial [Microthrixaceae bacterium]